MKKQLLVLFISAFAMHSYSQIVFEKGYYINNEGHKMEGLVKNVDWQSNPTKFDFKRTETSEKKTKTVQSVKEFGVYNISKYVRGTVNIDRSSEDTNDLSLERKPLFKEETLFLKVLVDGEYTLFHYIDHHLKRYFYAKKNAPVKQLIFKSYKTKNATIGVNNTFRTQLWKDLKCATFTIIKLEGLDYKKKELTRFFVEYNNCNNHAYVNFEKKREKDLFNLNIRGGINSSTLFIQNGAVSSRDTDFGSELGWRLGVEAEFILPFHKNKWAFIVEPTYQQFSSKKETVNWDYDVDYKSIELPIGVRHYFFLNENSKFFMNASYIIDFSIDSTIGINSGNGLEIKTRSNSAFGLGYKLHDSYSLEVRYQTNRDLLSSYAVWVTDYNTVSLIFGYSFF